MAYPATISKGEVDRLPTRTAGFHIYSLNFTVEYTSKFETTARVKSGLPSQFNAVLIFFPQSENILLWIPLLHAEKQKCFVRENIV